MKEAQDPNPNVRAPALAQTSAADPEVIVTGVESTRVGKAARAVWSRVNVGKIALFIISLYLFILAITLMKVSWLLQDDKGAASSARFLAGISEALVPSIVGFFLLTVAWVAVSLGMRRHI